MVQNIILAVFHPYLNLLELKKKQTTLTIKRNLQKMSKPFPYTLNHVHAKERIFETYTKKVLEELKEKLNTKVILPLFRVNFGEVSNQEVILRRDGLDQGFAQRLRRRCIVRRRQFNPRAKRILEIELLIPYPHNQILANSSGRYPTTNPYFGRNLPENSSLDLKISCSERIEEEYLLKFVDWANYNLTRYPSLIGVCRTIFHLEDFQEVPDERSELQGWLSYPQGGELSPVHGGELSIYK